MILRTRELLMRQRSQTANALRAHMAELGIIAGTGTQASQNSWCFSGTKKTTGSPAPRALP
jgi:transposase